MSGPSCATNAFEQIHLVNPAEVIAHVHDTLIRTYALDDIPDLHPLADLYAAIAKGERVAWMMLQRDENGERTEEGGHR